MEALNNEMPIRKLPFKLLKEITNDFNESRIIGSGAYGRVYQGVFHDGEVIAIKKLRFRIETGNKPFENELEHLKRLRGHWNIVKLVGFCDETEDVWMPYEGKMVQAMEIHRALCLEFLSKGGLGKFIPDVRVNWKDRFKIIRGICKGLKYIHEASVVHFDLKPDNILLDDGMTPKITDFGISRLLAKENDKTSSPLGTWGFTPPEFIDNQIISRQFDIFSLGVIIKRIVTGLMDYKDDKECIEHVCDTWRNRFQKLPANIKDKVDCKQVRTCIEIALDCMAKDRLKRPTMSDILSKLHEVTTTPDLAFFTDNDENEESGVEFAIAKKKRPGPPIEGDFGQSRLEGENKRRKKESLLRTCKLPLEFLCEITNDFSEERIISVSASATVFKGILCSGEEIAVKRFNGRKLRVLNNEFLNKNGDLPEIIEHESIVSLVGCCCEWKRKVVKYEEKFTVTHVLENLLCYAYVPNGSLDKYIYGDSCQLDWNMRFKIIMRICEMLHFLHTNLHRPINNLSLAPGNILLDKNMMPKLSDVGLLGLPEGANTFGFCQFPEYDQPDHLDDIEETEYVAPEHGLEGISFQSNIYNLGVLIMQITTGNKFYNTVRAKWTDQYIESKYASLGATSIHQIKLCIQTGLACAELDTGKRPSIQEIVKTLNSNYGSTLNKEVFVEEISQESTAELAGKDLE